jgi:hypothetical protein
MGQNVLFVNVWMKSCLCLIMRGCARIVSFVIGYGYVVTRKEFNDVYWVARRDHALWLHEHEAMNYTQVARYMGISKTNSSKLCDRARLRRQAELNKLLNNKRMLSI